MAENKTKPTKESPIDFVNSVPNERKRKDGLVLLEMMKGISGLGPVMWGPSIVGFGSYHYKYATGREGDMPMIAFSPRKQKLVLYVLTNFDKQGELLQKLGKHTTGSMCLYINKLDDVDLGVLEEIITECWKHMKKKLES